MPSSDKLSNNSFTLDQASDWTRRYREQHTDGIKGHHFTRTTLEAILAQPGCEGIRVYYGRDAENQRRLILVGTDSDDQDILDTVAAQITSPDSITTDLAFSSDSVMSQPSTTQVDTGTPCPPCCSVDNPLNS